MSIEMDGIEAFARRRGEQAREILARLGLFARWRRFGEPELVGAVRYGLAVAPDIDMEVYAEQAQIADGFQVMAEVAQIPGVSHVRFANHLRSLDQGLYWQIRYWDDGERWKVDCWYLSQDHPDAHKADEFARAMDRTLTPETRRAILEIKVALLGQEGVRGIDIYRAVLEGGVRGAEAFRTWIAQYPQPVLNFWMPE